LSAGKVTPALNFSVSCGSWLLILEIRKSL
jgi:hypothetical protein